MYGTFDISIIPEEEQLSFCLRQIMILRSEVVPLRKMKGQLKLSRKSKDTYKRKYKESKSELAQARKTIKELKKKLDKMEKTNKRLVVSVFGRYPVNCNIILKEGGEKNGDTQDIHESIKRRDIKYDTSNRKASITDSRRIRNKFKDNILLA